MKNIAYIDNFEEWKDSFTFSSPVKVRFSETDAFGHLNNTKVFIYLEEGRIEFFKELGLMQEWMAKESEMISVTSDIQCDYLKQVYFDDELNVFVKINSIGSTSLDLHYMIKNQYGDVCITGRGRMVQVHKKTGKPAEWNETLKKILGGLMITPNF